MVGKMEQNSYFNSHPHEEDDELVRVQTPVGEEISTHILTKRMTKVRMSVYG